MNSVERASDLSQVKQSQTSDSDRRTGSRPTPNGRAVSYQPRETLTRMLRRLRESEVVSRAMGGSFRALQRLGITVTPNHFYWPVPDVADLKAREWRTDSLPVGFELNLDKQVSLVRQLIMRYESELSFPDSAPPGEYHYNNGLFETVDAEMAYCLVRHFKPARIIEVGGGFSTRILSAALRANRLAGELDGELTTIEPFPSPELKSITNLISKRIQDVDMDLFLSLQSGDILFLDSSHVVSVGSDVVREYLEILPRLAAGVIVHVHDIFFPSDYPRDAVISNFCFWSEQYLLQAFLAFNPHFEVLWSSSAMQRYYPEVLMQNFPRWNHSYQKMDRRVRKYLPTLDHDRVWPSSFWMQRVSR